MKIQIQLHGKSVEGMTIKVNQAVGKIVMGGEETAGTIILTIPEGTDADVHKLIRRGIDFKVVKVVPE